MLLGRIYICDGGSPGSQTPQIGTQIFNFALIARLPPSNCLHRDRRTEEINRRGLVISPVLNQPSGLNQTTEMSSVGTTWKLPIFIIDVDRNDRPSFSVETPGPFFLLFFGAINSQAFGWAHLKFKFLTADLQHCKRQLRVKKTDPERKAWGLNPNTLVNAPEACVEALYQVVLVVFVFVDFQK
jgi:hypothetical protein